MFFVELDKFQFIFNVNFTKRSREISSIQQFVGEGYQFHPGLQAIFYFHLRFALKSRATRLHTIYFRQTLLPYIRTSLTKK
jgi:hypothetical protein